MTAVIFVGGTRDGILFRDDSHCQHLVIVIQLYWFTLQTTHMTLSKLISYNHVMEKVHLLLSLRFAWISATTRFFSFSVLVQFGAYPLAF